VDIRNPFEYAKGYLGEAVYIPVSEILTDESISFYKEMKNSSKDIILYGNNQQQANGTWMFLRQLGFDNVDIILGGYEYISKKVNHTDNLPENPDYLAEQSAINFAEFVENTPPTAKESSCKDKINKQIIPVKRKKMTATNGGC